MPDFCRISVFFTEKKSKKILAYNKQGSLNRGKKWFSEKLRKIFDLENFRSESFSRRTSCIGSSRFRARVAEGRPASRDHITGGNLESRIVYRGKLNLFTNSSSSIYLYHVLLLHINIMIQFCADRKLLSCKNNPVIKYACMRIRVQLCFWLCEI